MVSRRMLVTPLLAALLTLFTVACDGGARPTPTPGIRPTPTEARVTSTPEKNNSNQNIVTPTPTFTESTPTATIEPTPDLVNFPIIVECPPPACTPEELAYYNKRFREEFDYLVNLFGIKPEEQLVFKSENGDQFWADGKPVRVWKDQIHANGHGGITHELVHTLLLTPIGWYNEGLANVGEVTEYYTLLRDVSGELRFYDAIRTDRKIAEMSPHTKGRIFFYVLRRDYGWDPRKDSVPRQLYYMSRNGNPITEDTVFSLYELELGRNLSEIKEVMSYLKEN